MQKAAPGNLNTQRSSFMQGITGADDVSVLRTAGRPFPNVAMVLATLGWKRVVSSVLVEVLE